MEEVRAAAPVRPAFDVAAATSLRPHAEARTHPVEVSVVGSIESVDPASWDALQADDVFASHGWLRTVEACFRGIDLCYVLLRRDGRLVAASPCERGQAERPGFSPDALMFRRFEAVARRVGLSFHPILLCGALRSYGDHLMVDPRLPSDERERAFSQLLDAVEATAFAAGRGLWVPRVQTSDALLTEGLRRRDYHETPMRAVTYVDVEWGSFEEYLEEVRGISRAAAKDVRLQRNRFHRTCRIERIEDLERWEARLHQLADDHHWRLNGFGVPYSADFLSTVVRHLGEGATIYGAFEGDALIGFSLMLRRGDVAYVPITGIDPERARTNFAYFNVCYYRPIEDAIATGVRRLYAGTTQYGLKARRGFRVQPLRVFHRSPSALAQHALAPVFALHRVWVDRRTRVRGREDLASLRRSES